MIGCKVAWKCLVACLPVRSASRKTRTPHPKVWSIGQRSAIRRQRGGAVHAGELQSATALNVRQAGFAISPQDAAQFPYARADPAELLVTSTLEYETSL